jgi:hypothetical protein
MKASHAKKWISERRKMNQLYKSFICYFLGIEVCRHYFFTTSTIRLIQKLCKYHLLFFDTITIYVFWAWFIFWYVCNNFLNKTNNHSYKKRSMLINILIQRGLNITRGFHIRTIRLLWFIRRVKSTTGP